MSIEAALIASAIILLFTMVGLIIFVAVRQQAAKEEEMKRAASARGWKFEAVNEHGSRVHRWTGATDGVSWTAESHRNASGNSKHQRRQHVSRWHGAFSPGINGAVVVMGVSKDKEQIGQGIAAGDGFFASLAQKAVGFAFDKSIDVYFGKGPGKEVDAGAMQRLDSKIPGFIVMAVHKDEGARILQQGLESALLTATADTSSARSHAVRPWILLRPHTISLARMERFRDIKELDGFVRAGVALTRAFKFGRPA